MRPMFRPHQATQDLEIIAVLLVAFGILLVIPFLLYTLGGFFIVQPRTQAVVLKFGKIRRTITDEGVHYVFPFGRSIQRVTSSVIALNLPKMTVLEASGSPIEVSGICAYRVREAQKALLDVDNFNNFVALLASAVLKNVCAEYPYETPDPHKPCLRKENEVITHQLIGDLQALVAPAGIEVLQMRINDLTYAPEIAQSMLLRQQAVAMVDARRTIVEGAVWTVQNAQERMQAAGLGLDARGTESFAASLMMVLCSGERVQTFMPVQIEVGKEGGASHG
jgi:regulator of protease activity HflC (stomatin/prohibitin superfamily)